MKLFIIGNGFDLAHGIKSRYCHFQKYLLENEEDFYMTLMHAFDNAHVIWGSFEDSLPICADVIENDGLQMAQERLQELDYDPMSDEGLATWLSAQYNFINELPDVLRNWAESIDIHVPLVFPESFFHDDDWILTFNYTNTIECVYGVHPEQICHIHGDVQKPLDTLIMGHGDTERAKYAQRDLEQAQAEFSDCAASVFGCELEYLQRTYKYAFHHIAMHQDFFDCLSGCDEVHIIGCSLSKADRPYFYELLKRGLCNWVIYYYDSEAKAELEKALSAFSTKPQSYQFAPITEITTSAPTAPCP